MQTRVNAVAPNSPASGTAWIRHETATHSDPRHTHIGDSRALGQRPLSHITVIPQQHAATATARTWLRRPCGPVGLQINVIEITLKPNMTSAINRQVVFCSPRAARKAVSQ